MTGPGLVHLGLLYDGPDDLVDSAVAEVRRALEAGDDVRLIVDRRTVRAFREALGDDAEGVTFPPPSSMLPPSAPGFLATVQGWARPDRRTTVLGQYPSTMSAPDCGFGEDAVNLVLGDLPLTLICCCQRDLDPDLLAVARRTHPLLATTAGPADNADYRTPAHGQPDARRALGDGGGAARGRRDRRTSPRCAVASPTSPAAPAWRATPSVPRCSPCTRRPCWPAAAATPSRPA